MTTPNKGYATIVTGTRAGLWGDDLNSDVFSIVDNNMGGIVTKSVAGSNITLSSTESQMAIVRLTGAQSADIQVTNPCIGFYFVENLTTGNFAITMTNGVAGVVVPKGRSTVIADETNGCRIAGTDSFPPGTSMIFKQTTAPTGWTKITSDNNAAIRIVSGTASSGGSVDFSTAFASQTPSGTVGATALTVSQIPAHTHFCVSDNSGITNQYVKDTTYIGKAGNASTSSSNVNYYALAGTATPATLALTSQTGSDQTHTHTFTGNAINLAVKYVDFTVASKN